MHQGGRPRHHYLTQPPVSLWFVEEPSRSFQGNPPRPRVAESLAGGVLRADLKGVSAGARQCCGIACDCLAQGFC